MSPIINAVIPHLIAILAVAVVEGVCAWSEKDAVYGRSAIQICKATGFDPARMAGHLGPDQQETLRLAIEDYVNNVPYWMVNRAADVETGNDIHLTGQEVKLTLEEDINRLRTMKCYRGVRHASGNKVRGQRGRSNGRGGLTLGVSRKKV